MNREGVEHCIWPARLCPVGQGCLAQEEMAFFLSAYKGEANGNHGLLFRSAHCVT